MLPAEEERGRAQKQQTTQGDGRFGRRPKQARRHLDQEAPHLSYSPLILPFVVSAVLLTALLAFAVMNRREPIAPWLAGTFAALLVWTVGYIFELSSASLQTKLVWANVQFFGCTTLPIFWLMAMRSATGARPLPRWLRATLWGICAALIAIVVANPAGSFRVHPFISLVGSLRVVDADYGFAYYLGWLPFACLLLIASLVTLLRSAAHAQRDYRRRDAILVVATLLPMVGAVLFLADLLPWHNYNPAMAAITVSAFLCGYVLWRYRLFDVAPLARDAVIEHLADGVIVLDKVGRIVDFNPAASRVFPELMRGSLGRAATDVLGFRATIVDALERLSEGRLVPPEFGGVDPDPAADAVVVEVDDDGDVLGAGERHFSLALTTVSNRAGSRLGVAIVLHDVTRRVELFNQVQSLASTDGLTGVLTRRRFFELAEQELARSRRHELAVSLLLLDLDRFKMVNDVYGHAAGDEVLRAVAVACREGLRSFDYFGRFGGDEFCVLLPQVTREEALSAAERLRTLVAGLSVWCNGALVRSTMSVGVAGVEAATHETVAELVDAADDALYAAKDAGRDRVCVAGV